MANSSPADRFVRLLAAFRQRRDVVLEKDTLSLNELLQRARITWHGVSLDNPDWADTSHALAFTLDSLRRTFQFHVILNAYWEPLTFELPAVPDGEQRWRRCIDTALAAPDDIRRLDSAPAVASGVYVAQPRSVTLLARALA